MKVVILCGGKGTRMQELTQTIPKPLVKIGDKPILWHIMKIYAHQGFKDFILCLGYKGNKIKEYFKKQKKWSIEFVDTGLDTNTGGRIKRVERYIDDDTFFVTYGDGVANINLHDLLNYHKKQNKIATLTGVKPILQFGVINLDSNGTILSFKEKPVSNYWVNGGFFVFNKKVFDFIKGDKDILEKEVFEKLVKNKNLSVYKFSGFWRCMDTYKDNMLLNDLWKNKKAQWVIW